MPEDESVSIDVLQTAKRLQDFCISQGWRFCFIGGLAVQRWKLLDQLEALRERLRRLDGK